MTSKKVCLNVWRNAHAVVTAVQGEIAARWIEVSLYDHDKRLDISEKTAAIYMTKPDKTIVYNTCEILDAKNGLISVELTSQMSAVAGTICDCEIHIIDKNGSLLKILGLTIIIDRSLEDDKAIESSNEFTLLLKALKEADGLIDTVTEVLNEKLNEFDDAFDALSQQMQSQMKDWLAVKDEEILHKMQSVDDWLDNGDEQLQQAVTEAQTAVQAAVSQANTAADRANQAVEQMAQVAGELVEEAIFEQKNQPNGIAGLDSSGKLQQMPTANDIGAVSVGTTINGKALSGNITLMAQDVSAIASSERNQANGVAGLNESGKLIQMPTAEEVGAVPTNQTINGKALTGNITLTVEDIGTSAIFLASHPVGSLFETTVSTNPGTLYGGTWAAWGGGRVPVGVNTADNDFNTVEKTGGKKTERHEFKIGYKGYYGTAVGSDDNMIQAYKYSTSSYGTYAYEGSAQAGVNAGIQASANTRDVAQASSTGDTSETGIVQPYITCYIWKRTT